MKLLHMHKKEKEKEKSVNGNDSRANSNSKIKYSSSFACFLLSKIFRAFSITIKQNVHAYMGNISSMDDYAICTYKIHMCIPSYLHKYAYRSHTYS